MNDLFTSIINYSYWFQKHLIQKWKKKKILQKWDQIEFLMNKKRFGHMMMVTTTRNKRRFYLALSAVLFSLCSTVFFLRFFFLSPHTHIHTHSPHASSKMRFRVSYQKLIQAVEMNDLSWQMTTKAIRRTLWTLDQLKNHCTWMWFCHL